MNLLARFRADRRGNMAVLFAMGFSVSAVMAAIAVDGASLHHERRMIQNGVDLAALTAASNPATAADVARASLVEAGLLPAGSSAGLAVVPGHYDANPALAPNARFTPNLAPLNAVTVTFQRPGALYFARGWAESPTLSATALATVTPEVAFSLGSRLASLNGGIANSVLNTLLGTSIGLTLLDYQNLLSAEVDMFGFLDALAGQMGVTAGTYVDLLAMEANHGELAGAIAGLLTGVERTAMLKLAGSAGHNGEVPLRKLFALGELGDLRIGTGTGQGLAVAISALELLSASASLSDGNHQVSLALMAGIPGLAGISVSLAVGEPPQGGGWFTVGATGTVVRTAQIRLRLIAEILGSGVLLGVPIRLPLYLDVAPAEAVVSAATCPNSAAPHGTATILVKPGALRLMLGEVNAATFDNFNTTPTVGLAQLLEVKVLTLTVLRVLAASLVEIVQTMPIPLAFSSADIAANTVKTARTTTIVTSLATSLLNNLTLQVPILGLGLDLTSLTILLKAILSPLIPTLDLTLSRLLEAVGLALGEADIRVYAVRCTHPVLVG